ncbi:hypothetical protein DAI22_01g010900 [Oryza sativa Japonica Group]|nr:hypothetical protein DAI22_01g010900 [Oryza sativa Japonica Group]
MAKLLVVVLLLSLLIYAATAWDAESFFNFKSCPPNQCSKHGPKDTILYHPVLGSCKVTAISYKHAAMSIILLVDSTPHCPLQKLISTNLSTDVYKPQKLEAASLVSCSRDLPRDQHGVVGPITCLSNNASQWYLIHPYAYCLFFSQTAKLLVMASRHPQLLRKQKME